MCKCLLCQHNVADKTGSHIIPSFLMKRINGDGKRDHETGFKIGDGVVETYFGRSVYEDERKRVTDDEGKLESRYNYDTRDNVFCTDCEKYFSGLESQYATSLSLTSEEGSVTVNNKVAPEVAMLFWCSLIWRASVTGHLGMRLRPELEERLRAALANNTITELGVRYALFRCKDYVEKTGWGSYTCMDVDSDSVALVVDDFMLIMFFDMEEEIGEANTLGLQLKMKEEEMNNGVSPERIAQLPVEVWGKVIEGMIQMAVESMGIPKNFRDMHKAICGNDMPDEILREALRELQNPMCKMGDRYTIEHYAECLVKAWKAGCIVRDNGDGTFSFCR